MKVAEIYEASEALYYWAGSLKGDFPDVAVELDEIARHLDQTVADAEFIAAARTDIPALVAELRAARELEASPRLLLPRFTTSQIT
jgi:hypothetical protein